MTALSFSHQQQTPPQRIALIGARGSGKSTIGKHLARLLDWQFVDADVALEQKLGRPIQEIFRHEGESVFREAESKLLTELCSRNRVVIATGGGCVLASANRDLLRSQTIVIWLQADEETLQQRLVQDPNTADQRPALTGLGSATAIEEIQAVLFQRQPLYQSCAHFTILTTNRSPEEIEQAIVEQTNLLAVLKVSSTRTVSG